MSALVERIDLRLRQLPPERAAALERIIVSLFDIVEPKAPAKNGTASDVDKRAEALAALSRIAARSGIAGIADPAAWQKDQRTGRVLPERRP